jgi:exodeoxyribonuclease V beta subunit
LRKMGVHSVLYNMGHLFESREALEVERLLAAVASPADDALLKAALATDLLGVKGDELDRLVRNETDWDAWLSRFGEYHESWTRHGFFRMFRQLLAAEGVLPRQMALVDGERRCTNILHLSEVLHQAATQNSMTGRDLVRWLATQRAAEAPKLEEHQLRLESDENSVKLVTIHKSKGLEYPVVFCPFLWDGSRMRDRKAPFSFHDESEEKTLTLDLGSSDRERHIALAEKEQLAENLRLLYVALTRARNRCTMVWGRFKGAETAAPAYLFHPSAAADWDGTLDSLSDGFGKLDDAAIRNDLEELRSRAGDGAIELSQLSLKGLKPLRSKEERQVVLNCRPFRGRIDRTWQVASFSSLVLNRPEEREDAVAADEMEMIGDAAVEEDVEIEVEEEPAEIFSLPAGAATGTLIHEIFEKVDFSGPDAPPAKDLVADKLKEHGFDLIWTETLCTMIRNVMATELEGPSGRFSLSRISADQRVHELPFSFPLRPLSGGEMKTILSTFVTGSAGATFPIVWDRLRFQPLQGFMKGIIDLVFRHGEHYYLLDWKSNLLGRRPGDYRREVLPAAMTEHCYQLQYTLYAAALHRYLQLRLPGYRYESHFGGVYYLFVRGMDPLKGADYGVYRDRPPAEAIEGLCAALMPEREA